MRNRIFFIGTMLLWAVVGSPAKARRWTLINNWRMVILRGGHVYSFNGQIIE